ncbi:Transposable element Tc3 transposase, partial [Stegodyphus mimosarum]
MAKGTKLTDRERGEIEALSSTGMSSRAIAIKIGRSKTVVNNFLKLKDDYGKKNTGGRAKALPSRDERRVCQLVSTEKYSTRKLISTTGLKVCQKTIYNTIRRSGRFTYTAKLTKPQLLQRHKIEHLNFGQKVMTWDNQWIEIIFSDEKKWNLDGPDGWNFYWHDIKNEKEIFSKRQLGGGSVMTWGCFACNGVGSIAFVSGRMNSQGYQNVLTNHLLSNAECLAGEKAMGPQFLFMDDNAPPHRTVTVEELLESEDIEHMDWSARSLDLNPVKHVRNLLRRPVATRNLSPVTIPKLRLVLQEERAAVSQQLINNHISSMHK